MRDFQFLTILTAFTLFLFIFGVGDMALTDPDETFYAQTAKEMLNADEWITPHIFEKPQFEKPILYYLFVVISYIAFGVGEFAARFPSVLFGIAGVIGVYFLGRLIFSPLCGFLSGLILATSVQYFVLSRACVTDMVLAVFILYALLFFLQGWTTGRKSPYLIASAMAALAVLTKGPIGLFIPGVIVMLYVSVGRQWKNLKNIPIGQCILVFLAVSLPWYLAAVRIHGSTFINEFFRFQNVTRFLKPEHRVNALGTIFYYVPVLLAGFFPWTFFFPVGAWQMFKGTKGTSHVRSYRAFLLIWFLVVFVFFSIARTKLVTYVFPLYPVMAIVAGRAWEKFINSSRSSRGFRRYMTMSYYAFTVSVILALIGGYFYIMYSHNQALEGLLGTGGLFITGTLISFMFFRRQKWFGSFMTIVITVMIMVIPLVKYVLPQIEGDVSSKAASRKVKELAAPGEAIGGEADHRRGVAFYTDRTNIVDLQMYKKQIAFFSRKERVWGVIKRKHYDQLKKARPDLISEPVFGSKKTVVVTNKIFNVE